MIPKIIHYCWFGKKPISTFTEQCIESWKRYCPDYEIIQWNEDNFDINRNQYAKEAYEAKKWAFVSDYARIKVLYERGGIYLDSDVEVRKSLDDLLEYRAFSGFESDHAIPTGTMGAVENCEWIKLLLDDYDDRHFLLPDGKYDCTTNVTRITAITQENYNVQLNNTKQEFGNHMLLLPFDYLCAKSYATGADFATENTYTVHHFNGSWLSDKDKKRKDRHWRRYRQKMAIKQWLSNIWRAIHN